MSGAYASSKCYLNCLVEDKPNDPRSLCSAKYKHQARFCTDDGKYSCQAACYTKRAGNWNKEMPLNGADKLQNYNTSVEQLLTGSFDHFMTVGNTFKASSEFVVGEGLLGLDKFANESQLHIPVCRSKYANIADFSHGPHHDDNRNKNQRFPCTCGDWKSNETVPYMKYLEWDQDSPEYKETPLDELFHYTCKHNFQSS